jgi:hypothetical protein
MSVPATNAAACEVCSTRKINRSSGGLFARHRSGKLHIRRVQDGAGDPAPNCTGHAGDGDAERHGTPKLCENDDVV